MLDIGSTVKLCREARKLTLQDLSDRTDLTKSYLSRIENNQRDPTITALEKISQALHVPLNIIILLSEKEQSKDEFSDLNEILKKSITDSLFNA
ncbi:helix-turn-helix domain-containing protein [Klebsiella sp. K4-172]|uniref:helix-turn-helix domain-containing protein n=1 Tax=Klebsiella sp. K4-172 TaxID=2920185 RepID=UPI0024DED920|nr:helix-turn-helix transcriptional regulator [Klebsiella sp. K4-172]MDK1895508.1 helix-turn-helix domain-containing protein [Klebsiella sp. K4-172]